MHSRRSSSTARLIARSTLLAARDRVLRPLVPPDAEAPLRAMLAADSGDAWFNLALEDPGLRALLRGVEQAVLPGIITHYLARKRWLELAVLGALEAGCMQIVVLGAGFDSLAWRLHHDRPGVQFFELDHPATQLPKREALRIAANFTFLPADLTAESPATVLRACPAFSPAKSTLFIAEGLLMYFAETSVAALFRDLAGLTHPPAQVLFSFMAQAPDGSINFRNEHSVVSWWLRLQREPFQWGITRTTLPAFLNKCGLQIMALADHDDLRTQILAPLRLASLPLAQGECLCHCSTIAS